jgi:hypothetical protein
MFGVDFEALEPEHVETFLGGVSGEGLIWEGKGTAPLRSLKAKIVAGVCGLANQLGGYFIIGAEEDAGRWTFPGVENDCGEDPHDWIARILIGNLREPPPFEVRRWTLAEGRIGAVVRVGQTPAPPCMTKDGIVYIRVVGETRKVTDPRSLTELLSKGELARTKAEAKSLQALDEGVALIGNVESARFGLALAPTAAELDYSTKIFTKSFEETILGAAEALELSTADESMASDLHMHRDGYVVYRGRADHDLSWGWGLRATWNGVVAVGLACPPRAGPPFLDLIVEQSWIAAARVLPALTGIDDAAHVPTHLALSLAGPTTFRLKRTGGPSPLLSRPVQRWTTMTEPSQEELESVERELARSAGVPVHEPGSGSADA